jgi:hypothetical protein
MTITELNGLFRGIVSIVSYRERMLKYSSPRIGELMRPFFNNNPKDIKEYALEWTSRLHFAISKLKKKRKRMNIHTTIKGEIFQMMVSGSIYSLTPSQCGKTDITVDINKLKIINNSFSKFSIFETATKGEKYGSTL